MIPVFICEDERDTRENIKSALEKEILINGYDMEIVCGTDRPEELLDCAKSQGSRGIYFLDVDLKDSSMDGFGLGKEIRKLDSRGFLVYVTGFGDLAFETFRCHLEALDYIVKGDDREMFQRIRDCLTVINHRLLEERGDQKEYFTLKQVDLLRHIPMDDIFYFETTEKKHHILLHYSQGRIDFGGNLNELEVQLGSRFLRIHRTCLVNGMQIDKVDRKNRQVVLKNGERCWYSRKGKLVLEAYFEP